MANNRKNIRQALKQLLVDGDTAAGSNVFSNRDIGISQTELPSINIFTAEESTTPETTRAQRYIRDLELKLELRVEASEDADDDFDDLAAEVEAILFDNPSISGTAILTIQINTSEMEVDTEGEKPIAKGTLLFTCKYVS